MSSDDEIWAEETPFVENLRQYDADLVDTQDQSVSYGTTSFQASNRGDAIDQAREWARVLCRKMDKPARLILSGEDINGSVSEVIKPSD